MLRFKSYVFISSSSSLAKHTFKHTYPAMYHFIHKDDDEEEEKKQQFESNKKSKRIIKSHLNLLYSPSCASQISLHTKYIYRTQCV